VGVDVSRGKASGYTLKSTDAPIIFGMVKRGDRDHDIAAWFGVNQGRIAEVKEGSKFGKVAPAPANDLPPKGPPGIKGRRLRIAIEKAIEVIDKGNADEAKALLRKVKDRYDDNEM
jgi:hypothetical protein